MSLQIKLSRELKRSNLDERYFFEPLQTAVIFEGDESNIGGLLV